MRDALIAAGYTVITKKGIDAATMQEIADQADVVAGTAYNYFSSKDELVMAVMERVMDRLGRRIRAVSDSFSDPAEAFAYGVQTVMQVGITDPRWRWLMHRSEVIAEAMYRVLGRYAIDDIEKAVAANRFQVEDIELAWHQSYQAIIGFVLAVYDHGLPSGSINEAVVNLLCMTGLNRADAWEIVLRPTPELPSEESLDLSTGI